MTGLESACRQGLSLVLSLAVLAFVTPHDLGVYSLAFSFVLILALIIDDPVSEAADPGRRPGQATGTPGSPRTLPPPRDRRAGLGASGPVARLFSEPDLAIALPVLASSILIGSLGNIQKAHLTREMRFPALVRIALLANAAAAPPRSAWPSGAGATGRCCRA